MPETAASTSANSVTALAADASLVTSSRPPVTVNFACGNVRFVTDNLPSSIVTSVLTLRFEKDGYSEPPTETFFAPRPLTSCVILSVTNPEALMLGFTSSRMPVGRY
jgi:hypothetical protein